MINENEVASPVVSAGEVKPEVVKVTEVNATPTSVEVAKVTRQYVKRENEFQGKTVMELDSMIKATNVSLKTATGQDKKDLVYLRLRLYNTKRKALGLARKPRAPKAVVVAAPAPVVPSV